ncbi:hypothetical protein [Bradyrhizobium vignae]|nr:hypothetical protein [Bradyrhizobium vignae]
MRLTARDNPLRLAAGEIAVSDEGAGVGVAFDAMAFNQHDPIP